MKSLTLIYVIFACLLAFSACKTPAPVTVTEEPVVIEQEIEIIIEQEEPQPVVFEFPQMNGVSMEIHSIDAYRAIIVVSINFDNPNLFEISTPKITYNYFLNRNSFIRGIIENEVFLAPSSVTPVFFRMMVNYTDLFRSFPNFRNLNQVSSMIVLACEFGGEIKNWEINGVLPLRL